MVALPGRVEDVRIYSDARAGPALLTNSTRSWPQQRGHPTDEADRTANARNGTWARALTVLHADGREVDGREADGRAEETPSMVVIDTHRARGASNGGFTFHDRGGRYGRTNSAKRVGGSR